MSEPMLLGDILAMPYDPEKQRTDMELRQCIANEVGETIYPESIGYYSEED